MKTEIIAITDKSTSMQRIKPAVINGFNSFVKEQQAVPGEARVSLVTFSEVHQVAYQGLALADVPLLDDDSYRPNGTTALFDAICDTLETQGKRIREQQWADKVIVAILTDGEENASTKTTLTQMRRMIEHAQAHGWHFVFLAANQDAFATAASYGISAATTSNFTASAVGAATAYGTMSDMTRSLRMGVAPDQQGTQ